MNIFFQAIYYFLPAAFANMTPPLLHAIFSDKGMPIDAGIKWHGKELLGAHKTWRGLLSGTIVGMFIFNIQIILYPFSFFQSLSILNYSETSFFLGFLLSFGALFGDVVKSFFKRRCSIPSGKSWIPFDQFDFVIGGLVCSAFIFIPPLPIIFLILLLCPLLHPLANTLGYYLHLRDVKI